LVGLNIASISTDDEGLDDSRTGFAVGGYADIPVHPRISIMPDVLWVQAGARGQDEDDFNIKVNLDVISFDVLGKVPFGGSKAGGRAFGIIGPSFGYIAKARVKGEGGGESVEFDLKEGSEEIGEPISSWDTGLVFGVGYERGRIGGQFRYNLGLKSLFDDEDVKSRGILFLFSIGT
jgi:hypothetical protein